MSNSVPPTDQSYNNLNVKQILTAAKTSTNRLNTSIFGCPQTIINVDCDNIPNASVDVACNTISGRINLSNMDVTTPPIFAHVNVYNPMVSAGDCVFLSAEFTSDLGIFPVSSTFGLSEPARDGFFAIDYGNIGAFEKDSNITIVFLVVKPISVTTVSYVAQDSLSVNLQSSQFSRVRNLANGVHDIVKLPHKTREVVFIDRRMSQSDETMYLLNSLLEKSNSYAQISLPISTYLVAEVSALITNQGPDQRWVTISLLHNEVMGAIMGTWKESDEVRISMGIHFDPTRPENTDEKVYTLFLKHMLTRGVRTVTMKNIGGDTVVRSTLAAVEGTPFQCFKKERDELVPLSPDMQAVEIVLKW